MKKITTAYEARNARLFADAEREFRSMQAEVAEMQAKVARWEKKYAMFGGEVYLATLNKFRNKLAVLESRV